MQKNNDRNQIIKLNQKKYYYKKEVFLKYSFDYTENYVIFLIMMRSNQLYENAAIC